ncbi:MAG: DUF3810 domain-containing protein [Planctomycetes bacterium]|nr:DUF3810 domain-containing protein [Planctomycetota bacterium]
MQPETEPECEARKSGLPWWRTIGFVTLAGACGLCLRNGIFQPEWVEHYYSQGLYPRLRGLLSWVSGPFSFSLAEALTVVAVVLFLTWGSLGLHKARRDATGLARAILAGGLRTVRVASGAFLAFLLLWGVNHGRLPLAVSAELPPVEDPVEALQSLCQQLVSDLNRDGTQDRPSGAFEVFGPDGAVHARLSLGLAKLAKQVPSMGGEKPNLRTLTAWPLFARLGISGIFIPFTGEAHLNGGQPPCSLPFVAFHEIAHQRGFAREDEANFLGWLLCEFSGDPHYRYSGNLAVFSIAIRSLRRSDPEQASRWVGELPEPVLKDLRAIQDFWNSYESPARKISMRVNDAYLKSQGQVHGVRSYGRMLELMFSYRAKAQ